MRVLIITSTFLPRVGGTEIVVANLAKGLVARGHEVGLICPREAIPYAKNLPYMIIPLPKGMLRLFDLAPGIAKIWMKRFLSKVAPAAQWDIVQWVMAYPLGLSVDNHFRANGIPQVVRACGADIQKKPELNYGVRCNPEKEAWIKASLEKFDACVANSESVVGDFKDLSVPSEKITLIPNGIDFVRFQSTRERRSQIRKDLGISEGTPVFITVGRNHPKKGFDLIPKIATELQVKGLEFKWVLVGKGTEQLQGELVARDLAEKFLLMGEEKPKSFTEVPSNRLMEFMVAADLFVFPTLVETFGMVTLEAMAAGTIPVTSRVEGSKDIVADGTDGVLCDPGDYQQFADIISQLSKSQMISKLREAGFMKADRYDWSAMVNRFEELYNRLQK